MAFNCDQCSTTFTRKFDMKRHIKLKHGEGFSDMNISSVNSQATMHYGFVPHNNSENMPQYSGVPCQPLPVQPPNIPVLQSAQIPTEMKKKRNFKEMYLVDDVN